MLEQRTVVRSGLPAAVAGARKAGFVLQQQWWPKLSTTAGWCAHNGDQALPRIPFLIFYLVWLLHYLSVQGQQD